MKDLRSERIKLEVAIMAAYDWLRDEADETYLSPSTVECLVHAARWWLEHLEAKDGK